MTPWARVYALIAATLLLAAGGKAAFLELDRAFPPDLGKAAMTSPVVRAAEGEILRVFATPDEKIRLGAAPGEVDPLFLKLLIAVEDKRFPRHGGVDTLAVLRASWQALRQRRIVSGASTLTMQVARLLEPRPRRLRSKVIEAFRAWQLERRFTKDEILGLYLTLAPTAAGSRGFGRRAWPGSASRLPASARRRRRFWSRCRRRPSACARTVFRRRQTLPGLPSSDGVSSAVCSRADRRETALPSRMRPWPLLAPHLARRVAGEAEIRHDAGCAFATPRRGSGPPSCGSAASASRRRRTGGRTRQPCGPGLCRKRRLPVLAAPGSGGHGQGAPLARLDPQAVDLRPGFRPGCGASGDAGPGCADRLRQLSASQLRRRLPR